MSVPPPPTSPRPSALRSLLLLAAVLAGLVVVRWSVTGGLSRPLAPPAQTRVHASPAPTARDLAGRRWTLPYDAEPVAVVPQGVVIRDLQNRFEVRDPHGKRIVELGHDLTFLDRHGSLLAYLDDRRLHLHDLATGGDRTLASPTGARSGFALGPPLPGVGCCLQVGAFSPDARLLAVFTQLAGPGQPRLSIVDVASGRA